MKEFTFIDWILLTLIGSLLALAIFFLSACAQQQPQSPAPVEAPSTFAATPHRQIPPDPLASLPPAARGACQRGNSKRGVRAGFAVFYPYRQWDKPTVYAADAHATTIVLAPDEEITSAEWGDPVRWSIHVSHNTIHVKPCAEGCTNSTNVGAAAGMPIVNAPRRFSTNLELSTSRNRLYDIDLQTGPPMDTFVFCYPDDIQMAEQARAEAVRQDTVTQPARHYNFAYIMRGPNVPWKPERVFDDGTRTYLHFSNRAALESDMPTLYVQQGKTLELVNFVPNGDYYMIDRLFTDAVLTVGTGKDRPEVTIEAQR